ncbi:MAG: Gfo/Idh/MocA family oxidoreductase [Haloferacaceae archaeon]
MTEPDLRAGVVGVGSMGRHHARVYRELPDVRLAGVADADPDRAATVADAYGTRARPLDDLLDRVDLVSVAVPTGHHYELTSRALDRDVHALVEKPFVETPAEGRRLVERADERGLVLQVGHVERFNPAVEVLSEVVAPCDVVGVSARRLGPPVDRSISDGVVLDLMLHDVDVLLSVLGPDPEVVAATGTRSNRFVGAQLRFDDVVAQLTASRLTQRKVRTVELTTTDCYVAVDYIDQSVEIHRRSLPEYVETDGDVRHRTESVVEHPAVGNDEPLRRELSAFVDAVAEGTPPPVTGEDGLRALELAREIDRRATRSRTEVDAR